MSRIHKRHVQKHEVSDSPKKCKSSHKTDENLKDLKLKIESILNEYPVSNKTCSQNIPVVGNCPVSNTGQNTNLNYFTSEIQINTLKQTKLFEIPFITSRPYQNNHSKSSNNNQSVNRRNNLIYLTGAPKANTARSNSLLPKNSSDLSETDLQVLLQNFYKLEGEEQQMLITHLKKLEDNNPDVVEKLKKFVRVSSPEPEKILEGDTEFNDLDDLDDILEETVKLFTDSESDDDCVVINVFNVEKIIDLTQEDNGEESQALKRNAIPEKISEILEKSAGNYLGSKKEMDAQKIKINLLSNQSKRDEQIANNLTTNETDKLNKEVSHKITHKKQKIVKESPTDNYKDLDRTNIIIQKDLTKEKTIVEQKTKNTNHDINLNQSKSQHKTNLINKSFQSAYEKRILEKRRISRLNNFKPNSYKEIYSERIIDLESPASQEMEANYFGYRNYKEMQEYLQKTGIYCDKNLYYSFFDNA